ncbi:MAG: PAS domain S-box protein, partial [Limisphaerales bacterium]
DEDGDLTHVIHRVEDVTDFIRMKKRRKVLGRENHQMRVRLEQMEAEIDLHQREAEAIEGALRDREARLETIFNQVAVGIAQTDLTGRLVLVNDRFCDIVGRSREALLEMHLQEITHPDDLAENRRRFGLLATTGQAFAMETEYIRPDGSIAWIQNSVSAYRNADRKPQFFVAVVQDVTERRQAEREAVTRSRQHQALMELSQHALAESELESLFNRATEMLVRMFNVEFARVLEMMPDGKQLLLKAGCGWKTGRIGSTLVDADLASHAQFVLQASKATRAVGVQEPTIIRDLEDETRFRTSSLLQEHGIKSGISVVIYGDGDSPYGILGAYSKTPRAFTKDDARFFQATANVLAAAIQRHRVEERLRESTERLTMLSKRQLDVQESERRQIARGLHDEIGQALTAVELNLQNAMEQCPKLASSLQDGIAVIEQVLDRVKTFSLDLRPTILDDLGLVVALRWYANQQAKLSGLSAIVLSDTLQGRLDPALETACFRIAQEAITNIIRHAKATGMRIELRVLDGGLHLIIRDNGIGFDVAKMRKKIGREKSLGLLGMAERAALVGGHLEITSTATGTHVHARFPLAHQETLNDHTNGTTH